MTVNVYGDDLSNWQRPPWPRLPTSFIFAKATEGKTYRDPSYKTWRRLARKHGKTFGAYHFARPEYGNTAQEEAAYFLRTAKLGPGDLAILDYEVYAQRGADWVEEFCDFVDTQARCDTLLYTNRSIGEQLVRSGHRPLWIADPSSPEGQPVLPSPWSLWTVHQFGTRDGVDRDVTNGLTGQGLKQFGVKTINAHKRGAVKAVAPQRRLLIETRNSLRRLFYLAHIPWNASA